MQTIDRLGWAAGFSLVSYGVRVGVRLRDASDEERVLAHLPPGWRPAPSPVVSALYSVWLPEPSPSRIKRLSLVYENAVRIARTAYPEEALVALGSALRLHVAERATGRIFVHAGVVAWKGRAIVIPGRSHSGKSRLVDALVRAGATYYSDEYAILDGRGRVHPFPAPLKLRKESLDGRGEMIEYVPPESEDRPPLRAGLVAVTRYEPSARWRPRRLSAGQGVLALLDNTVPARRRPSQSLRALEAAVRSAVMVRSLRGDAASIADEVLSELSCRRS